jgi:hypothetical protein
LQRWRRPTWVASDKPCSTGCLPTMPRVLLGSPQVRAPTHAYKHSGREREREEETDVCVQ